MNKHIRCVYTTNPGVFTFGRIYRVLRQGQQVLVMDEQGNRYSLTPTHTSTQTVYNHVSDSGHYMFRF